MEWARASGLSHRFQQVIKTAKPAGKVVARLMRGGDLAEGDVQHLMKLFGMGEVPGDFLSFEAARQAVVDKVESEST